MNGHGESVARLKIKNSRFLFNVPHIVEKRISHYFCGVGTSIKTRIDVKRHVSPGCVGFMRMDLYAALQVDGKAGSISSHRAANIDSTAAVKPIRNIVDEQRGLITCIRSYFDVIRNIRGLWVHLDETDSSCRVSYFNGLWQLLLLFREQKDLPCLSKPKQTERICQCSCVQCEQL